MERKEFIKSCAYLCIGCATLTALIQSCSNTIYFANATFVENKFSIKKSEFQATKNNKTHERKYVIVKSSKLSFPIYLSKISIVEYSALPMVCSHKGCELMPQGGFLVCPCHGSEFNNKGIVQNPPAEQNLKPYKTSIDNENIYIYL